LRSSSLCPTGHFPFADQSGVFVLSTADEILTDGGRAPAASKIAAGPASSGSFLPKRRLILLFVLLLSVGTAILYAPAVRNSFVNLDDPEYVTRNAHVLDGLTWPGLVWAFSVHNQGANFHPLTWISHMLDVQWYGTNPAGHHFTAVLLQTLDVVLLFLVLVLATRSVFRSAAVAALFALHPLNVEAVAWVAERKSVLCMMFLLLAMWAYLWYTRKPSVGRYLCVVLFFVLGLLSKIMVMTLPLALLLLDYWPLGRFAEVGESGEQRRFSRSFMALVIEKIPLFLLAVAGGVMTVYIHTTEHALAWAMPFSWRIKNVIYSYLAYLGKAIWPSHLAAFYPHPENSLPWWKVILAAMILAGISALVWRFRQRRYLVVGWLWYLGTMFPMIGLVQSGRQGMADRYMYVPIIGVFVAVVWLLADWAADLKLNQGLLAAVFVILIFPYAYIARTQIGYWRNSFTLFTHALQVTQNNGIAENDLGAALLEMGQPQLAWAHFDAAARIIPELASPHYNLGVLLQTQNRLQEAAQQYQLAIAVSTDPFEASQIHNNLGILNLDAKNSTVAMKEFNAALALNPTEQHSYLGRGMIELQSFNFDAAIADFSRAAQISPSPVAYLWLGRALERKGDYHRAEGAYRAALQLAPGLADARTQLEGLRNRVAE
jgi:tetratricopeptide (TPR) repeat protein